MRHQRGTSYIRPIEIRAVPAEIANKIATLSSHCGVQLRKDPHELGRREDLAKHRVDILGVSAQLGGQLQRADECL